MDRQKALRMLELYSEDLKIWRCGDKTFTFARCDMRDVVYLEKLTDDELLEEGKNTIYLMGLGCHSVYDSEYLDLINLEVDSRSKEVQEKAEKINEGCKIWGENGGPEEETARVNKLLHESESGSTPNENHE